MAAQRRAERLLLREGYTVVARNYRCRIGELDLVCRDGNELVFVEVRSRKDARYGDAAETVNPTKQRQLARVARVFLASKQPEFDTCRFDVVALTGDEIELIRDAFRP